MKLKSIKSAIVTRRRVLYLQKPHKSRLLKQIFIEICFCGTVQSIEISCKAQKSAFQAALVLTASPLG